MSLPALPEIRLRPAYTSDASFAAQMIYLSMGRLADYLFVEATQTVESFITFLFTRNAGRFGFGITVVAELADQPVGILVSCAGVRLNGLNLATLPHCFPVLGMRRTLLFFWRAVTLPGGREAEKDEYYLSNLGVLPSVQGRGIGSHLLEYAEQAARINGLPKCSLIVGLHNERALQLYQRSGYRIVETTHDRNEILGYHRLVKAL
jgi:ribosomal protein S18 acetylase RimI-like enzyme